MLLLLLPLFSLQGVLFLFFCFSIFFWMGESFLGQAGQGKA